MKIFVCSLALLLSICPAAFGGGFLFVTFHGEGTPLTEQIYLGLSRDGRQWEALNGERPVLVSNVGEKGVRDPYIFRAHEGGEIYLVATDLDMNVNHHRSWQDASDHGSQSVVIWETTDLVHWSEPRLVKVAPDDAGCTWAPEVMYDDQKGDYLVYWASRTGRDHFAKHRIWACKTKDFQTFGAPFIYIEKANDIIDTDIVRENGEYYRFSKDETTKTILMETCDTVLGSWREVPAFSLAKLKGFEGPACFPLASTPSGDPGAWGLLLDRIGRDAGYQPFVTHDLSKGQFTPAPEVKFPFRFRHGAVLPVTDAEMDRLNAAYGQPGPVK